MHKTFIILYVSLVFLSTLSFYSINGSTTCKDHRKIFTAKSGYITHGDSQGYKDNQRCQWLIKGDVNETISIFIPSFYMECGYDSLFVHNGNSRRSNLLAIISGLHQNIKITSTSNEVFILMHSDGNLFRSGFNLSYAINKCPNHCSNNGNCINGVCKCSGNTYGESCQYEWCHKLCNQALDSTNQCNIGNKVCDCGDNYYGESCSLQKTKNTQEYSWHTLSTFSEDFQPHAGHVSGYYKKKNWLVVYAGYDLNSVHGDLLMFDFSTSKWLKYSGSHMKPPPRQNHAGVIYEDALFIFGGSLQNDSLTNDLWKFNFTEMKWTLLAQNQIKAKIAGHSMTLANSKLYIIGGRFEDDKASVDMYMYDIKTDFWNKASSMYGKSTLRRLVGHTSCYYEKTNQIYVFGGVALESERKIPNFSNQLFIYEISTDTWHQLDVTNPPAYVAYHTAVIVGDYMVVHGGRTKSSISGVDCSISGGFYYFNLQCHTWVSEDVLTKLSKSLSNFPPSSRFDHSVIVKDFQTLIFSGGVDGVSVKRDIIAFKLPHTVIKLDSNSDNVITGSHCTNHDEESYCEKDPSCVFCFDNNMCYPSNAVPSTCSRPRNKCKSICSLLKTCESCSSVGSCVWYSISQTCYYSAGQIKDISGWWGSNENLKISNASSCQTNDKPAGLTYTGYLLPGNPLYPDIVKVLSIPSLDIDLSAKRKTNFKLKGQIYPYIDYSDASLEKFSLHLKYKNLIGFLNISQTARSISTRRVLQAIHTGTEEEVEGNVEGRMFPFKNEERFNTNNLWYNVLLDLTSRDLQSQYFQLQWNYNPDDNDFLRFIIPPNYLKPYETSVCSNYKSCTMCISDQSCGWCQHNEQCLLRSNWVTCKDSSTGISSYLIRNQTDCVMCDDYFDCESCIKDKYCSWKLDSSPQCKKSYLLVENENYVAKNIGTCPSSCKSLTSVSGCLLARGCIWCSAKNVCLPYSHYFVQNHYGQCHAFYDKLSNYPKNCEKYDCKSCLSTPECGWCYNSSDPRIGSCTRGDFSGADIKCASLNSSQNAWAYSRCPDINECALGIASCKNHSTCKNTDGDYLCPCDPGYIGDGKLECEKTCWPSCVHGKCLSNYTCSCDLGWIGPVCSIDCGCNNHSTCNTGVGVCDKCQDYTTGDHCEQCVNGSYGNATSDFGCRKCECNGHGDPDMNFCNITTGECFCLNNTEGRTCDKCKQGFVGDPSSNGICHLPCSKTTTHFNATSGYIIPYDNSYPFVTCVWIITANSLSYDDLLYHKNVRTSNILLTLIKMEVSCLYSHLYVYDGLPPNPRSKSTVLNSHFILLGDICGSMSTKNLTFRSTTGVMTIFYQGNTSTKSFYGVVGYFEVLSCPCLYPFVCQRNIGGFTECVCNATVYGSVCQYLKCPNNCSETNGKGVCDTKTFQCKCNTGYYGNDCSLERKGKFLSANEILTQLANGFQEESLSRLGFTMHVYGGKIYVIGGTNNAQNVQPFMIVFDYSTNEWKNIVNNSSPKHRFFHCSFIYKNGLYVYGGTNGSMFYNELWVYHFHNASWTKIFVSNRSIILHKCILINDRLYIIGGFIYQQGLNEDVVYIDLIRMKEVSVQIVDSYRPGMYGHVSFYDETDQMIYTHGGISFYQEFMRVSNRVYGYNINSNKWFLIEDLGEAPALFGHIGERYKDNMYFSGGYTSPYTFNEHVYIWKIKCNHWTKVEKFDVAMVLHENLKFVFASSLIIGKKIYIFGGFNGTVKSQMLAINIQNSSCTRHYDKLSCTNEIGCNWCSHGNSSEKSFCYSNSQSSPPLCSDGNQTVIVGKQCNRQQLQSRDCETYTSCLSCLGGFPDATPKCQWCRKPTPRCIPYNQACPTTKNTDIKKCFELTCSSSVCANCERGNCKWTSYFVFQAELVRLFSRTRTSYNCFTDGVFNSQRLGPVERNLLIADMNCPRDCSLHTSCEQCLQAFGDYGGSTHCVWNSVKNRCMSEVLLAVECSTGHQCGQLIQRPMTCPKPCSQYNACWKCITRPDCGWCAHGNQGDGECLAGRLEGPLDSDQCGAVYNKNDGISVQTSREIFNYTWAFAICPLENECSNGNNDCTDLQLCEDLPLAFKCVCKPGYEEINGVCTPICSRGCVQGKCVRPDECQCNFGWTSPNCTVACQCNDHSNCANETHPDICLQCLHNTQGRYCEECKPLYVQKDNKCTPCSEKCFGNTDICAAKSDVATILNNMKTMFNKTYLREYLKRGPQDDDQLECIGCGNNSEGKLCQSCVVGYFKNSVCEKCRCNGHGDSCDKNTGTECTCRHNTQSSQSCKTQCYKQQCNQCKRGFHGNPKDGRQCYKQMQQLAPEMIAVNPAITSFHIAKPGFTNVDIRVYIDVFKGEFDVYITDADDRFGLSSNVTDSLEEFKVFAKSKRKKRDVVDKRYRSRREVVVYVNKPKVDINSVSSFVEFEGQIQYIGGVKKRLVVTISHTTHDLSEKWFYIALIAKNNSNSENSRAFVYYRQDLPRIDLLLFFSILVLVLLLILCAFILGWKLRSEGNRQRIEHEQQERIIMLARRPKVTYTLFCEKNDTINILRKRKNKNPYSTHRKSTNNGQDILYIQPIALQNTEDNIATIATVFVQYPGNELTSWNFGLGTSICLAPNQKLLQVRTSYQGARNKKISTRILTTST